MKRQITRVQIENDSEMKPVKRNLVVSFVLFEAFFLGGVYNSSTILSNV